MLKMIKIELCKLRQNDLQDIIVEWKKSGTEQCVQYAVAYINKIYWEEGIQIHAFIWKGDIWKVPKETEQWFSLAGEIEEFQGLEEETCFSLWIVSISSHVYRLSTKFFKIKMLKSKYLSFQGECLLKLTGIMWVTIYIRKIGEGGVYLHNYL